MLVTNHLLTLVRHGLIYAYTSYRYLTALGDSDTERAYRTARAQ